MTRLFSILLVFSMALALVACATTKNGDMVRVKCPACGYEFNALAGEN